MKLGKFAKVYSMSTQGILSMGVYAALGFFVGYAIDKNSFWPVLLAVVGMLLGLCTFISYLLYLIKEEEKEKKKNETKSEN